MPWLNAEQASASNMRGSSLNVIKASCSTLFRAIARVWKSITIYPIDALRRYVYGVVFA